MDELDKTMTRYLLGELSEQEQAALEKRYFADREVFNQLLQVEGELVDDHARGQLSTEMRQRFERSYLTHPSRRERVEFAKALNLCDTFIASATLTVKDPQTINIEESCL